MAQKKFSLSLGKCIFLDCTFKSVIVTAQMLSTDEFEESLNLIQR